MCNAIAVGYPSIDKFWDAEEWDICSGEEQLQRPRYSQKSLGRSTPLQIEKRIVPQTIANQFISV